MLNLNAFNCPYFIHFCHWLTLASKINRQVQFSGKCQDSLFFCQYHRGGRSLSVEAILKLRNLSFISALFDSWQISVFKLHRSIPGRQIELFQFLILMNNKYLKYQSQNINTSILCSCGRNHRGHAKQKMRKQHVLKMWISALGF